MNGLCFAQHLNVLNFSKKRLHLKVLQSSLFPLKGARKLNLYVAVNFTMLNVDCATVKSTL